MAPLNFMDYSMKQNDSILSNSSISEPKLSKAEVEKTLDMVSRMGAFKPLKEGSKSLALARQQVHFSGDSDIKVVRSKAPRYDKPKTSAKKLTKRQIAELKNNKQVFKGASLASACQRAYQGIFDTNFKFGIEAATTENMRILIDKILEKVKSSINESKVTIEHVLKMDGETLNKIVVSLSFLVAGIAFCGAFSDVSVYMKFLFGVAASMAAAYPFLSEIRDYVLGRIMKHITGVNPIETFAKFGNPTDEEVAEVEEMSRLHEIQMAALRAQTETQYESWIKIVSDAVRATEGPWYESSLDSIAPMLHMICEFIASIAGVITGFCFTGDISKIVKSITTSAKTRSDLQCIINEALKWISGYVDMVSGTSFKDMFSQNAELENWGESVHAMYIDFSSGKLEMVPSNSQRVSSLTIRGGEIARKQMSMSAGAWAYHRYCSGMLAKMEAQFNTSGMPSEERQIPLCVCFRGASGVGKSYVTNAFIDELAMRVLKGERQKQYVTDHAKEKWLFLPEEDHANGYNGQFATIIDDMGQFLTQKGQKDDMQQIIRWCNAAPCRLNAAELEKKGSLVFNSPLVMASTNLYQYWSPSLALPEAFVRRFDIWVDMVPHIKYCTEATKNGEPADRRLDRSKVNKALNLNLCEYRLLKVTDPIQQVFELDRILTFKELVDVMVKKFQGNKDSHEALMGALHERRTNLFERFNGNDSVEVDYEGNFQSRVVNSVSAGYNKVRSAFHTYKAAMSIRAMFTAHKEKLMYIACCLCALVAIYVAIKVFNWFKKSFFCKNNEFHTKYEAELLDGSKTPILFHNMLIRSILTRNVFHMYRVDDDPMSEESFGTLTMITGRICMLNAHYIDQMKTVYAAGIVKAVKLYKHGNTKMCYTIPITRFIDPKNISMDSTSDIALINLGEAVQVCRDIKSFFCTDEAYLQNRDFETILVAARSPHTLHTYRVKDTLISAPLEIKGNVHTEVVIYEADTQVGDCGSLLYYTGDFPNHTERIVGIHMAGVSGPGPKKGYAGIVTQAKLAKLLEAFEVGPEREFSIVPQGDVLNTQSCHEIVTQATKPVFQPSNTAIIKSKLYAELHPVTKAPAHLSTFTDAEGEKVSPLMKAHAKQNSHNVHVDENNLDIVKKEVYRELKQFMVNTGSKLTIEEAIVGRADLKALGPIPRKTSAGYTYAGNGKVKQGKKQFFGSEGDYVLEGELYDDLKDRVQNITKTMEKGIVPEDRVYMDILKDETLPLAKVEIGKTRMISACDLPMSVIYRQYYGAVCNDLVVSRLLNGMAIGINPYSQEWEFLTRLLKAKGDKVVAGDFGSYDNSQTCQLIQAVMWIMSKLTNLTSENDLTVMKCLSVTLSQPYHVSGSKIYELDHGMPSGNPMTSIMNSVFGLVVFRLCWGELMQASFYSYAGCIRAFSTHVKLVMYGDDNLLNISDEVIDRFNQTTMMSTFPRFGLTYTSDEKTDANPPPFRNITQVTFLKRSFIYNDVLGRHACGLDIPTIYNMLHYTKKGGSSDSITVDNCYNAVREASLHGKIFFEYTVRRLLPIVKEKLGHDLIVDDYETAILETTGYKPSWMKEHI